MTSSTREYLGDAVYAEIDNYRVKLTTEDGDGPEPTNTIYLEPEVYQALLLYVARRVG